MAETTAIISSAGGIIAGTPFALGAATFVQQVTPPVVNTSRLVLLGGAWAGISAPGLFAGAHSFVLGEDVEDSPTGVNAILIGYKLRQNNNGAGQASDQLIIGHDIQLPLLAVNSADVVFIGHNFTLTPTALHMGFGNTVAIGPNVSLLASALADAFDGVVIGASATMHEGKAVVVGSGATSFGDEGTAIGFRAAAGNQCVAVGSSAQGGTVRGVSVGSGATASDRCVAVGWGATTAGSVDSLALGQQANTNGAGVGRIAIGSGSLVTTDNTMGVGSTAVPILVWEPGTDAVTDLGVATTRRFKDLHLAGVVVQDGADGAAANAAAIVNAPTAKAFQWVPFTFNGAPGWLLWQPA